MTAPNLSETKTFRLLNKASIAPIDKSEILAILEYVYYLTPIQITSKDFIELATQATLTSSVGWDGEP